MKKVFNFVLDTTLIVMIISSVNICVLAMKSGESISDEREAITFIMNCANSYGEFKASANVLRCNISDEYRMEILEKDGMLVSETYHNENNVLLDTQNICECSEFLIKNIEDYIKVEINDNIFYMKQKVGGNY